MKGMYRSRSTKRQYVRAPKRTALHFKEKQKGWHKCAECGAILHGVPKNGGHRPSRKYGGYLCHECLKKKLVESVRA